MAKFNFNLKDSSKDKTTPIVLIIRWNDLVLKYPTNEIINPINWNHDLQLSAIKDGSTKLKYQVGRDENRKPINEIKHFEKYQGCKELNYYLNNFKVDAENVFRKFMNDNDNQPPTPEQLRTELDKVFKKEIEIKKTLFSFIEKYIDESLSNKKPLTIKQYKNTLMHLKEYSGKLDFKDITVEFYTKFTNHLSNKNLSPNTIGKIIKTLKTFLNQATERKINKNIDFKNKLFKVYNESTEKIYLTESEIDLLYNLDLSDNNRLEKVRDLFLIGCYTALRFSDFSQIQPENIIKNGTQLKVRTIKTDESVIIPLHYRVIEIIKKYNKTAPKSVSNQKMNDFIKEIAKMAKINETVFKTEIKGNKRIDTKCKKYELITTHTARRSAATNMFLSGIKPINLMKITGHKTESAFMRYIRISGEENADLLMNHKYFNQPLKIAR